MTSKLSNTAHQVVRYWAERGYDVSDGGEKLVNGLPASVRRVATRKANAKHAGKVYLGDIYDRLGQASDKQFLEIKRRALARAIAHKRLDELIADLDRADLERINAQAPKRTPKQTKHENVKVILHSVAAKHGVSIEAIKSYKREKRLNMARFECYFLLRNNLNLSSTQIGRAVGGRDHTTVLYGCKKYEAHLREGLESPEPSA